MSLHILTNKLKSVCDNYFETGKGVFCLGDSREILKHIPSASVDVIITDPPWGVRDNDPYDNPKVFFEVENELYRVLKNNSFMLVYYSVKNLHTLLRNIRLFNYYWLMVVAQYTANTRCPVGYNAWTPVVVFIKGKPKIKFKHHDILSSMEIPDIRPINSVQQFKSTIAHTELLNMFTNRNELVLDPFAGYGSLQYVCEIFDRRWIAIEIDPEKYEIAKKLLTEGKLNFSKNKKNKHVELLSFTNES